MIIGLNLSHDYALCRIEGGHPYLHERERTSRIRHHWVWTCYTLEILDGYSVEDLKNIELLLLSSPCMRKIERGEGNLSSEKRGYRYRGDYLRKQDGAFAFGEVVTEGVTIPAAWVSHYHAHGASALIPSGFQTADILCLDGGGDFGYGAILRGRAGEMTLGTRLLGWKYGRSYHHFAEKFFGKKGFHEGKLMAVAAYGNAALVPERVFGEDGRLNPTESKLSVHHAARCQLEFEEAVMRLLEAHKGETENLVCAGGCFLNVILNRRVADSGLYRRIYIPPYVTDMGAAIGAALMGYQLRGYPLSELGEMDSAYLGDDISVGLGEVMELVTRGNDTAELSGDLRGRHGS